jgi:vancomycin resistance protein YoaR
MRINIFNKAPRSRQKRLIIAGVFFIAILLLCAIILSAKILVNPYVYSGVYLDGVHLGGLSEEQLKEYLQDKYTIDFSSMELNIFHKDYPVKVSFNDLNVHINSQIMYNQIYDSGRKGSFFQRLMDIYRLQKTHLYLNTEVFMDLKALDRLIEDIYQNTYEAAGSPSLFLMEDEVYIRSGVCGYTVNREQLKERLVHQINQLQSGIVIVPVVEILPARVDVDAFYDKIVQEPRDASVEVASGEIIIIPESTGRSLDKASFLSSVAELEAKSKKYPYEQKLPVVFTKPEKTVQVIEEALFRDVLAEYKTSFPTKTEHDKARAENIRLAVEAIDGTILLPGEAFSFNDVVGVRTTQKGYRGANVYTASGISQGVGGGICQVSTTLYNACLEANLRVDERNPHTYTIAYAPLGRDAAISYGSEDYRFTNSTNWPIKISGKVKGNEVSLALIGTDEYPSLEVVVQPSVLKIIPYETEYVEDNTLSGETSVVKQAGMNGAVVDTFYTIKNGKDVISSYKLHTTTYKALPEIIHISPQR